MKTTETLTVTELMERIAERVPELQTYAHTLKTIKQHVPSTIRDAESMALGALCDWCRGQGKTIRMKINKEKHSRGSRRRWPLFVVEIDPFKKGESDESLLHAMLLAVNELLMMRE